MRGRTTDKAYSLEGHGSLERGSAAHPDDRPWGLRGDLLVTNALLWVATARRSENRSRKFIYTFTIAIGVWRGTTRGAARGRRPRYSTIRPKHITDAPGARGPRL